LKKNKIVLSKEISNDFEHNQIIKTSSKKIAELMREIPQDETTKEVSSQDIF